MLTANIETISPETAKEYLRANNRNRLVRPESVDSIARDIRRGTFVLTHQGIAFDENGRLIDGQHRLLAILKANTPVTLMVTRGLPANVVDSVDRGINRSVADAMRIKYGASDSIECKMASNKSMVSAVNQLVNCGYARTRMGIEDTNRVFSEFAPGVISVYEQIVSKAVGKGSRAPIVAAAIAAAKCGADTNALTRFFEVFNKDDISGCENFNCQAALNWRRQIDNARAKHVGMSRKKLYLGTQNAIYHFLKCDNVGIITVPDAPRYDVNAFIKHAFDINEN